MAAAAAAEVLELEYFLNNNNKTRLVSSLSTNTTTTETETQSQIDDVDDSSSDLRRGPWAVEEDLQLINYVAVFGEGRWNSLARLAGLKRTGKSCRLRWLNYLRPDLRRGNMTPEEQLLILQLHSRWGNRWSKIAQQMPGRTDNEIKNYWRTRVQKHAKQLHCDINSKRFKEIITNIWMPRLVQTVQQQKQQQQQQQELLEIKLLSTTTAAEADHSVSADHCTATTADDDNNINNNWYCGGGTSGEYICCNSGLISCAGCEYDDMVLQNHHAHQFNFNVSSADEWMAVGHY